MEHDPQSRRPDAQEAMRGMNHVSAAKARGEVSAELLSQNLQTLADLPAEELTKLGDVIKRASSDDK